MTQMPSLPAAAVLAGALAATLPSVQAAEPAPVVAIVTVPKPWYAPQFVVARRMRDTIPQYAQLPGLAYKMYSFAQADGQFGGIYFWRSREQAQAWFGPAWHERVRRERGVEGTVRLFDAPLTFDPVPGGPPAQDAADAVATLVLTAAATPHEQAVGRFRAATAQAEPGLLRTHLIVTDDGRTGQMSVWADATAAATALARPAPDGLLHRWGPQATLERFDVPILLPTRLPANRIEVSAP